MTRLTYSSTQPVLFEDDIDVSSAMNDIELPPKTKSDCAVLVPGISASTFMVRVGDQVKWAFGRQWVVLAIDGDEAWVKSSDRCSPCRRTAPLSQLRFSSALLEA